MVGFVSRVWVSLFLGLVAQLKKGAGGGLDLFGVGQAWGPAVGGFILIVILVVLPLPLLLAVFMVPECCLNLGPGLVQSI